MGSLLSQPPDLLSNIAMAEDGGSMNVLRLTATDITFFSVSLCLRTSKDRLVTNPSSVA